MGKVQKIDNKREKIVKLATWNIRGLNEEGALKKLVREIRKYSFDVVAIQETKQKENQIIEIEDYIYFNSGDKSKIRGTGFIVHKKLKQHILQFQAISDRMCCLRLKGRFQKITLINVHAPTEKTDIEVKEEFYETLDKEYGKIKKYDLNIVL